MYTLKYLIVGPISIKIFMLVILASLFTLIAFFFNNNNKISVYNSYANEFEKTFWSGIVLEEFFEQNKKSFYHPIASIFVFAMNEWNESKISSAKKSDTQMILDRIKMSINTANERIKEMLSEYSNLFSLITIAIPILSLVYLLFLTSGMFFEIGMTGKFEIDQIANMIAGSIVVCGFGFLTTAASFYVLYNVNTKIDKFIIRAETFGSDLYLTLSKELQQKVSTSYEETEEPTESEPEEDEQEEVESEDEDEINDEEPKDVTEEKKSDLDDDI